MKRTMGRMVLGLAALASCAFAGPAEDDRFNLLKNPGFEQVTTNGQA